MKLVSAVALSALCLAWSEAAAASPVLPGPVAADETVDEAALKRLGNRLGIDVTIDGTGPYRFMVDSGANRTVVSRGLAEALRLAPEGQVDLHSMSGQARVDTVRVPALEIGGIRTSPLTAPVLEEAHIGGTAILGIDVLQGKRVTIDMAARRMTICGSSARIERAAPDEIVVVAKRRFGQLILTQVTIDGLRVDAVIDSGSEVTIGNAALEARLSARRRANAVPLPIVDVIGRTTIARVAPLAEMKVGDLTLTNVDVAFADTHAFAQFGLIRRPALLIGMDVLRAFRRVSIDFASRSIRFLVEQPGGGTRLAGR